MIPMRGGLLWFTAVALALAASAVAVTPVTAEPVPTGRRPRVGLVLSGGGALGLAHIGVLKMLEEMHVGVDCVAGTSMGAIVGGLYAAGYSPAEIEALAERIDWHDLLQDRPDRRQLPFRRKVDDLTYLIRFEAGYSGGKVRTPPGLVLGHKLALELVMDTLRVASVNDFDRLPLPFRAVATDIDNGRMVVLDHGSLAEALRASMAIPGVFAPAIVDGRVLVDGGLVRGLPVDVARAMGAEVVIAVDLGVPLSAEAAPDSLEGVMARTSAMMNALNVEKVLPDVDVLIRPTVEDIGALDFAAAREIVPRGEAAGGEGAAELGRLARGGGAGRESLPRQRRTPQQLEVGTVRVDAGPTSSGERAGRLVSTMPGQPLDEATLRADVGRLYDLGEFEAVDLHLTPREGVLDVDFEARPKRWGPNFLRFGANVFADLEGQSEFNVLVGYTMTGLNRAGGEFKTEVQMGQSPLISTEIYQPVTSARTFFVAASAQGSQVKTQVPVGSDTVQYRFQHASGGLDLGLQMGRWGELRLGLARSSVNGQVSSQPPEHLPDQKRSDSGYSLRCILDQLDNTAFPKHGFLVSTNYYDALKSLGADLEYRKLTADAFAATSWRRHTCVLELETGSALGGALPPGERLSLGGLFRLSGLPAGDITGSYGGVAALLYTFRLGQLPAFSGGLYLGASLEAGNLWETQRQVDFSELHHSYSVFLGADTALGPVYLAHGQSDMGKDSFYLFLGRTF
jgi:NTE family protein